MTIKDFGFGLCLAPLVLFVFQRGRQGHQTFSAYKCNDVTIQKYLTLQVYIQDSSHSWELRLLSYLTRCFQLALFCHLYAILEVYRVTFILPIVTAKSAMETLWSTNSHFPSGQSTWCWQKVLNQRQIFKRRKKFSMAKVLVGKNFYYKLVTSTY